MCGMSLTPLDFRFQSWSDDHVVEMLQPKIGTKLSCARRLVFICAIIVPELGSVGSQWPQVATESIRHWTDSLEISFYAWQEFHARRWSRKVGFSAWEGCTKETRLLSPAAYLI